MDTPLSRISQLAVSFKLVSGFSLHRAVPPTIRFGSSALIRNATTIASCHTCSKQVCFVRLISGRVSFMLRSARSMRLDWRLGSCLLFQSVLSGGGRAG
jgi:hypothetical protein